MASDIQESSGWASSLKTVFESLKSRAAKQFGRCELMCGIATDADFVAISVAESLGMPVHLILPIDPRSLQIDFNEQGQEHSVTWPEVERYIQKARDVRSDWSFRVAIGDNVRPDCYHDANLQMLEVADVLVAVHDGTGPASLGGTAEVIHIASQQHLQIPTIVIDPTQDGKVVREDEWKSETAADNVLTDINSILASHKTDSSFGNQERTSELPVWRVFQTLDNAAAASSLVFRNSLKRSIWFHFWATICATIAAAYAMVFVGHLAIIPKLLAGIELILVTYAFLLIWKITRSHSGKLWRLSRLAAEITDSLVHSAGIVDPLHPLVVRHNESWKQFALSVALTANRQKCRIPNPSNNQNHVQALIFEYVQNRIGGQLDYLRSQSKTASNRLSRWKLVAQTASFLAVPAILAALVMKIGLDGMGKDSLTAFFVLGLPIALPLLAGLASSLIMVDDSARRSTRYRQVIERLERYSTLLKSTRTVSAAERIVFEVEDILLDEIIEWNATAKSLGH